MYEFAEILGEHALPAAESPAKQLLSNCLAAPFNKGAMITKEENQMKQLI